MPRNPDPWNALASLGVILLGVILILILLGWL